MTYDLNILYFDTWAFPTMKFRANKRESIVRLYLPLMECLIFPIRLSGNVVFVNWVLLLGSGGGESLDKVEFVTLFAGEDGRFFVVFHQLLHCVELALSDAVQVVL